MSWSKGLVLLIAAALAVSLFYNRKLAEQMAGADDFLAALRRVVRLLQERVDQNDTTIPVEVGR